ncbi:cytochrome P450 3A27-like isoform X1 [Lytechinus pictus]|uniref:cytochrome P450 3A27-like isoform X1 n=1 Tax=Lytechinus pictus TaxID=7653 RepID=UPI0030B9D645
MYTTLLLIVCVIILYFTYDKWCRTYFKRQGIPSPPSIPVFGNFIEWFVVFHDRFAEYFQKYGKIVGVYNFRKPTLLVSDPDVVRKILVKDFDHFVNRDRAVLKNDLLDGGMLSAKDERWRQIRNLLSPSFTSVKLKRMFPLMKECAEVLVDVSTKCDEEGKNIECKELYGPYAMDVIGSCAFGLRVNSQTNQDEPFIQYAKRVFNFSATNPVFLIVMLFPWTAPILNFFKLGTMPKDIEKFFLEVFEKAIADRQASGDTGQLDFLQLMLSAHKEDGDVKRMNDDDDDVADLAQETSWKPKQKTALNRSEIIGNAITFLLAGYETSSTGLGFVSYLLATNQHVQDHLIEEVKEKAPSLNDITFETVTKMEYLNMVIMESMRIYPPGELLDRVCNKEITYNNITIKKGQHILIPIWNLQHDPDLWPDPETFDPERFSKDRRGNNHPCGWLPFGMGPHSCIGVRFALLEIKVAMVCILQKFYFEICPETEIPPKLGNLSFLTPPNGINLRILPQFRYNLRSR